MIDYTSLAVAIGGVVYSLYQQYRIENICATCPFNPRNNKTNNENKSVVS